MKSYRLRNGYSISLGEFYDGYTIQTRWCIYEPSGRLYMSCGTYMEAYELASHLKDNEDIRKGENFYE